MSTIYAAERSDATGLSSLFVNVVAMGVAYVAATAALLAGETADKAGPWVVVASPLPVLVLAAYQITLLRAIVARAQSCRRLERSLHQHFPSASNINLTEIGVEATEPIFNIDIARGFEKMIKFVPYVGAAVLVLGHIAMMTARAWRLEGGVLAVCVAGALYLAIAVATVGGSRQYLKSKARDALPTLPS